MASGTVTSSELGQGQPGPVVAVTVNGHRVLLWAGKLSGLELKQEAVAQGAALGLSFDLWVRQGEQWSQVYDAHLTDVRSGQEYVAVTTDDHGWMLPGVVVEQADPAAVWQEEWVLRLSPQLWAQLSGHLFGDGGEHAAVLLTDLQRRPLCPVTLTVQEVILADDDTEYLPGSTGYRSLTSEFILNAALQARDERLGYVVVHNHPDAAGVGFSHLDRASLRRGFPALQAITGQPVAAVVLTPNTATGELWLPNGARQLLGQVVIETYPRTQLFPITRPALDLTDPAGVPTLLRATGRVVLGAVCYQTASLLGHLAHHSGLNTHPVTSWLVRRWRACEQAACRTIHPWWHTQRRYGRHPDGDQ